jgi:hydrogenase maturation protease
MIENWTQPWAPAVTVVGVGNEMRQDDGVGLLVARRLRDMVPPGVRVEECGGEPMSLMECWEGSDILVIVDAVCGAAGVGTIYRLDATEGQRVPDHFFSCSTHDLGVSQVLELARALKKLPPQVIIYGIEASSFEHGAEMSPEVADAAESVIHSILGFVEGLVPAQAGR